MKPEILLVGGGGHCKALIDVIEAAGQYTIAGIIDRPELIGEQILGYRVIGCDDDLSSLVSRYPYAIVSVGQVRTPDLRKKLFALLERAGYVIPSIISPRAYVSPHARVERGSVVMHDALINAHARVGANCIVNTKALIEHDCRVGDHCHVSTGAILNGATVVGEGTFVGSNAVSKEGALIAEASFIKAGSIVT
ncbi:MAG: acetyltransferase [Sulfuricurvum sp. MLSB]|uniref:NeuD/PglB/VioB family sugar acetyltransferase n=1 Tax=unclassified Sulfuricurvum TaxID=2632390 RepID=UPI000506DC47|nr:MULTISPECIES: NeuD/PglB/VioB family sugar acetyltransferase [unclassified Sulfuricurvum]KFN40560.1 MAG: acetyltransferase [Sulfuricurvum sp. MLSB]